MAFDFVTRSKQVVGLDIGSSTVKMAELRPARKGGFELVSLGIEELSPECVVDGVIISKLPVSDAINRIFSQQNVKNKRVATSVSGHSVIVKKIALPAQSQEELSESIRWEAEQYIPFDIADEPWTMRFSVKVPPPATWTCFSSQSRRRRLRTTPA